ncbi:MAG: glycosyltransferase [Anaerolineales bacterium]|nr:glycosyltransferase [Anaerolineales bacterium]
MASLKEKSPRIAIVAASAPPYGAGGVASAHYNLWSAFRQRGFAAKLFTFFDNDVVARKEAGVVRHGVGAQWVKRLFVLANLPMRLLQPGRLVYHTAEILRNAPGSIRMTRSIDTFDPEVVLLSDHGAPGLWLHKRPGQRFVLVSHHNPARLSAESGLGDFSRLDTRLAIWLENRVLAKVDHVICPSRYMRQSFKKTYRYHGPISVVPNLVDLSTVDAMAPRSVKRKLKLPQRAKIVYLPSAGSRIKGAKYLVDIIDGLVVLLKNPLGFYIPGHIETDVLQALKQHPAANRMLLPGQVNYREHIGYVKMCDVAVSPALMENFSMAIVEAAYLGVPVVAFRRGGNADIIEDGENGYLVPKLSATAMAKQTAQILNSPGLQGVKRATKTFTRQKFAAGKVLDAYLSVLLPQRARG